MWVRSAATTNVNPNSPWGGFVRKLLEGWLGSAPETLTRPKATGTGASIPCARPRWSAPAPTWPSPGTSRLVIFLGLAPEGPTPADEALAEGTRRFPLGRADPLTLAGPRPLPRALTPTQAPLHYPTPPIPPADRGEGGANPNRGGPAGARRGPGPGAGLRRAFGHHFITEGLEAEYRGRGGAFEAPARAGLV
eukprot:scaffold1042_cov401-Prasinococcus_capsulatus_cf.AAC.10